MKTAKLVLGIVSMVLSIFVIFQSCVVGIGNTLSENGEISGSGGIFVAIMLIIGGIVIVAGRKSKGAAIAAMIVYAIGSIIGFANAGSYGDLYIWSALSLVIAIVLLVSLFVQKYDVKQEK